MADINSKDVFDVLLQSLKKQADEYLALISQNNLTHDQRKDYDSEIKQMFELLSQMTNSTIVLSSTEIESLKLQFQTKLQELQTILDNPNITTVKGADGKDGTNGLDGKDFTFDMFTPEQLVLLKGEKGQNGIDGKDFTFDMFTPEQLVLLKGEKGQNGIDGKDFTFDMFTTEQLISLKGADGQDGVNGQDGQSFTFDMFTPEQLQQIVNLISVPIVDLTPILNRITELETKISSLGGSVTPEIPTSFNSFNFFKYDFTPEIDDEIVISVNVENVGVITQTYLYSSVDGNLYRNNLNSENSLLLNGVCLNANFNAWPENVTTLEIHLTQNGFDGAFIHDKNYTFNIVINRNGNVLPSTVYPLVVHTKDYNLYNSWISQWL